MLWTEIRFAFPSFPCRSAACLQLIHGIARRLRPWKWKFIILNGGEISLRKHHVCKKPLATDLNELDTYNLYRLFPFDIVSQCFTCICKTLRPFLQCRYMQILHAIKCHSGGKTRVPVTTHLRQCERAAWAQGRKNMAHMRSINFRRCFNSIGVQDSWYIMLRLKPGKFGTNRLLILELALAHTEALTPWPMSALKLRSALPAGWPGWGQGWICSSATWKEFCCDLKLLHRSLSWFRFMKYL